MKTGKPVSPYEGDIMIVDDEAANVELLMEILSGTGYRIRTASDGNLALRSAQVMPPALVLLDIKMPGMDGYEVCRRLKENEKTCSIPVIFISVLGEDREKAKAFQVGGVDYVTRPFQPQEVLARIETHLTLWKVQQELELRNAELETWNLVLAEEIAERKHAQQDLAVEKERLAVTLRSIGDGVITTDTQGTVVSLNKVAETLTGWTEGEAVGRPLEEVFRIINEQTRQPCENPVQKVLETGQVVGLANHTLLISRHGTERIL
ncbi:MAG: response regulator, partial [Deltaproteobacteria bacterium]|nr:response regulator [Deltaproteobacteria bacterium]